MAGNRELLRVEAGGGLSFGDYTLASKTKQDNFEYKGDIYKVKTYREITKLEKNGMFVYESVPGTSVENLKVSDREITCSVSAPEDVQITLGVEPECDYEVFVGEEAAGRMSTNLSGKLSIGAELSEGESVDIRIVKCSAF